MAARGQLASARMHAPGPGLAVRRSGGRGRLHCIRRRTLPSGARAGAGDGKLGLPPRSASNAGPRTMESSDKAPSARSSPSAAPDSRGRRGASPIARATGSWAAGKWLAAGAAAESDPPAQPCTCCTRASIRWGYLAPRGGGERGLGFWDCRHTPQGTAVSPFHHTRVITMRQGGCGGTQLGGSPTGREAVPSKTPQNIDLPGALQLPSFPNPHGRPSLPQV